MITLVESRDNLTPLPSLDVLGRRCFAVRPDVTFALLITPVMQTEGTCVAVISFEGANVVDHTPASKLGRGAYFKGSYVTDKRRYGAGERSYMLSSEQIEHNQARGLVAALVFVDRRLVSAGTAAGARRSTSAHAVNTPPQSEIETVEFDSHKGWAARGVFIPELNSHAPWAGEV